MGEMRKKIGAFLYLLLWIAGMTVLAGGIAVAVDPFTVTGDFLSGLSVMFNYITFHFVCLIGTLLGVCTHEATVLRQRRNAGKGFPFATLIFMCALLPVMCVISFFWCNGPVKDNWLLLCGIQSILAAVIAVVTYDIAMNRYRQY